MNELHSNGHVDWRATLQTNQRKTIVIIGLFVFIYLALGFLLDLYIHGAFEQNRFQSVFYSLIHFQMIPMATITMGGVAIIALLITYTLHDQIMLLGTQYHEVTARNANSFEEEQLYHVVEEMKIAASLNYMPKVYIIEADYMNAFASGYSEKSAMIAITRGLLKKLDRSELQAVIAHELSHIRHGDIKLTLTASVLSNLMLIVLDIFFYNIIFGRGDSDRGKNNLFLILILLRYLLPLIMVLLILFLSRTREYMADAGSVELMRDNTPLGKALLKISQDHDINYINYQKAYGRTKHEEIRSAAYIYDPTTSGLHPLKSFSSFFSTHPSLADRLKAIGFDT